MYVFPWVSRFFYLRQPIQENGQHGTQRAKLPGYRIFPLCLLFLNGFPGTLAVVIAALRWFLQPLLSLTLTQLFSSGFEFSFVLLTSFTVWATAWFTHCNVTVHSPLPLKI